MKPAPRRALGSDQLSEQTARAIHDPNPNKAEAEPEETALKKEEVEVDDREGSEAPRADTGRNSYGFREPVARVESKAEAGSSRSSHSRSSLPAQPPVLSGENDVDSDEDDDDDILVPVKREPLDQLHLAAAESARALLEASVPVRVNYLCSDKHTSIYCMYWYRKCYCHRSCNLAEPQVQYM